MPKKVDELVKRIKEKSPDYDDSQAYATAWSIYCRYVNPDSPSCRRDSPKDYFPQRKASKIPMGLSLLQTATTDLEAAIDESMGDMEYEPQWAQLFYDMLKTVKGEVEDTMRRIKRQRSWGVRSAAVRITDRYLAKYASAKLDSSTRNKINKAFLRAGLDGNTYFIKAQHGFQKAHHVLMDFGIEPAEVGNSHVFNQKDGKITQLLAFSNPEDPFSPVDIRNSMLVVTFHEMQSGRYEVIAYLS